MPPPCTTFPRMNISIESAFRRRVALASPPFVIALGYLVARLSEPALSVWAWVPVTLVYWTSLALLIGWAGEKEAIRRWLRPSTGAWGWRLLANYEPVR